MEDRDIRWSNQLEDIIAGEGEKCRGLAWIHQRAEVETSTKNTRIMLPVIVLSTLSGTVSVGSSSLFAPEYSNTVNIIVGLVSISVGVLNTINSFFAYSKRAEAHRIAHLNYSKLFTWVSVELSLPRAERLEPENMLKQLREQMERLAETTPSAPPHILADFRKEFDDYKDVTKPPETNGLARIKVFRSQLGTSSSTSSILGSPRATIESIVLETKE